MNERFTTSFLCPLRQRLGSCPRADGNAGDGALSGKLIEALAKQHQEEEKRGFPKKRLRIRTRSFLFPSPDSLNLLLKRKWLPVRGSLLNNKDKPSFSLVLPPAFGL
jgi:hypothetical protein